MKLSNNIIAASFALFITGAAAAAGPVVPLDQPGAEQRPALTLPREIAIVRKALEEGQVLGRMDTFYDLFDADFVDHTPLSGSSATREAVRQLYIALRDAFPDLRATTQIEAGEGDLITVRRTFEGTHTGAAFMNAPTSGRAVRFEAMDIVRVKRGKITERWGVMDLPGLLLQLRGVAPARRILAMSSVEVAR